MPVRCFRDQIGPGLKIYSIQDVLQVHVFDHITSQLFLRDGVFLHQLGTVWKTFTGFKGP